MRRGHADELDGFLITLQRAVAGRQITIDRPGVFSGNPLVTAASRTAIHPVPLHDPSTRAPSTTRPSIRTHLPVPVRREDYLNEERRERGEVPEPARCNCERGTDSSCDHATWNRHAPA
jgi:hypothetical protein